MKALLLKEFLATWNQGRFMMLLALIYCIMAVTGSGYFFAGFSVIFMSMLPITVMGWDEKSKWDHYALTMPYSRKDMVLSKYVFSLICTFTATIVYIIATIVKWYFLKQPFDFVSLIDETMLMLSAGLFFSAVNFPIMFKLGVEKGRMWFILITVILASGIASSIKLAELDPTHLESIIQRVTSIMPVISVGLLFISAVFSIKIYGKREF